MAVTEQSYTGNGSTTNYSFTFPYLKSTDIEVQVDAVVTTAWSLANATTVQFNTAPSNGAAIKILRDTNVDNLTATFYAGSAIKSEDLNDNFTQNLYVTQEIGNRSFENTGTSTMIGNLNMGEDTTIVFEGATNNDYETTLTVTDPTADRTITLPNVTGTVLTTADTGTVTSTIIADGTIATGDIANSAITTAKINNDAITADKIADDVVNSEHYAAGSIDTEHIADSQVTTAKIAGDAVTGAKIADDSIDSEHYADGSIDTAHIADDQVTADKLANTAVTAGSYTATDITVDAQGRITAASNGAIATSEITDGAVTTAKIAADAIDGTKIADDAINSEHYTDGSIDTAHIADSQVTTAKIAGDAITEAKIADDAVTTDHIADAELTTLAGMQSGTASILAGGTALTATLTEINTVVDGKGVQTTISDSDAHYPTSGAVVDYVAAQIAPIGGLEVIANEDSFPTTQPASGVVISIADAAGIVVNGSGVSTTARKTGSGSDDVTINNFPSSLYSETLASGVGLMVTSTGSSDTYNYHKILAAESDVKQLSDDINDFNARYRVNAGEPGSNNDEGDLVYDTNADKMKVYDSSTSAWKEVTSTGDFKFLVAVDAGTTTAATFDGSDTSFDLKEATNSGSAASVTNVNQLMIVLNGVVQKPNAGSWSGSGEGFYLTDADTIRFATAPPTGSTCFIVQSGSAVSIPTPGDNTVSTAKIQNLAVTTAKIAADAIDGTKLADDAVAQEHIADEAVDEARIQISNAGSNGQYLQKQSGNTGGLTWATPAQYTTPLTTRGDILYRAASADARLAKGTEGQYLKIGANDPEWADVVAATANGTMWENNLTVSNDYTIASTKGAHSVGPVTLNATVTVNGRWVIS